MDITAHFLSAWPGMSLELTEQGMGVVALRKGFSALLQPTAGLIMQTLIKHDDCSGPLNKNTGAKYLGQTSLF